MLSDRSRVKVKGEVKGGTFLGYQASVEVAWDDGEVQVQRGVRRKTKEQADHDLKTMMAIADAIFMRDRGSKRILSEDT